ncbi:MAG: efflux transporter outer membrane subunit, partial [Alphaproteobacteria bacterium]|nr:efflux transporter outer membrane subunit [Alphaproteobacteria bacterium]
MSEHLSRSRFAPRAAAVLAGLLPLLVAACAVGPNFKRPATPKVSGYTTAPLAGTSATTGVDAGNAQHFAVGHKVEGAWWTLFRSKPLDRLISEAITKNPDLKAAQAALRVALETERAQRGSFFPSVAASFSGSRNRASALLAPVPANNALQYNLFTPEVTVSYMPDVFGLNRRTAESFAAQTQAARFQMIATYNTLVGNVVVTAVQLAALDAQISATRKLVAMNTHMVHILKYQFKKGYASGVDYAAQKAQLAQVAATLPPLQKQRDQLQDLLAVLVGRYPSQQPRYRISLSSLSLPGELPVSLPSRLVRQRPDIRQAEANLHAASAQVGIAIANMLPNIELTANAGNAAIGFGKLFTPGTDFWDLGASLTAPIFQGGTLLHQERAARAAYKEAAAQYRSTVLTAFENVADTLAALKQDADALTAAAAAEQ